MRVVACVLITVLAGVAHADTPVPRNAISVHPLSLQSYGVALQYERDLAPSRFSLAGELAVRAGAGGDYDSLTLGIAGELRFWLRLGAPYSGLDARAMVGPFVAARFSAALTSVQDARDDRSIGSAISLVQGVSIGYRFAFFHHVELSAALGPAVRVEIDPGGRLPTAVGVTMAFGLTAGWLF
jgi:hypothetical protein